MEKYVLYSTFTLHIHRNRLLLMLYDLIHKCSLPYVWLALLFCWFFIGDSLTICLLIVFCYCPFFYSASFGYNRWDNIQCLSKLCSCFVLYQRFRWIHPFDFQLLILLIKYAQILNCLRILFNWFRRCINHDDYYETIFRIEKMIHFFVCLKG